MKSSILTHKLFKSYLHFKNLGSQKKKRLKTIRNQLKSNFLLHNTVNQQGFAHNYRSSNLHIKFEQYKHNTTNFHSIKSTNSTRFSRLQLIDPRDGNISHHGVQFIKTNHKERMNIKIKIKKREAHRTKSAEIRKFSSLRCDY